MSIDGSVVTSQLDAYAPTLLWQQAISYSVTPGSHTITVAALGQKNASASGTYVTVDGFVVDSPGDGKYDDISPLMQFTGGWLTNGAGFPGGPYNATQHLTRTAGDTVTFSFIGTEVTYFYAKASNLGQVAVFVDGLRRATIDAYSPSLLWNNSYTVANLLPGPHTIAVTALGTKSFNASDTYATVDSFLVGPVAAGTYDDLNTAINFTPSDQNTWSSWISSTAVGGSYHHAYVYNQPNVSASLTFTGTQITYLYQPMYSGGLVQVAIDHLVVTPTLDQYSSNSSPQSVTYSGLGPGPHTITVTALGRRNPLSYGNDISVDGFIVGP